MNANGLRRWLEEMGPTRPKGPATLRVGGAAHHAITQRFATDVLGEFKGMLFGVPVKLDREIPDHWWQVDDEDGNMVFFGYTREQS